MKDKTFPYVVPAELTPFIWKKYTWPDVNPVALAVTVAVVEVEVVDAVGFESQVNAPAALVPPDVDRQKVIVVLAPLAFIEPLRVAEVAPMEVASFVVAEGAPAAIVRVKVLDAVAFELSVTLKVKLVLLAVVVGVPVM